VVGRNFNDDVDVAWQVFAGGYLVIAHVGSVSAMKM
jgi:hypothetical protein